MHEGKKTKDTGLNEKASWYNPLKIKDKMLGLFYPRNEKRTLDRLIAKN